MRVSPLATAASFLHSGLAAVRIFSLSFRILFRTGVIGSASSVVLKIFLILLFICPLLGGSLWLLHIVVCCLLIHLLKLSRSRYQSSNNVSVNPSAPCALCGNNEMSSFTEWLAAGASRLFFELFKGGCIVKLWAAMCFKRQCLSKVDNVEENEGSSLLDLPELALEAILSRLPASSLCQMAGVCKELRESCRSNHLWERLLEAKWGKIAGPAAHREWQSSVALNSDGSKVDQRNPRTWIWTLSCIWPFSLLNSQVNRKKIIHDQPLDSLMAWYWALESGNFWFPAQVYNREHGHVGFMLSCYDAELSYDRRTNTFKARYPPHGPRTVVIEEGVQWERLRAPPVDTPTHELHVSDCLDDLQPGDHVEVQWRRNKEFPYGWWYGVVGHDDMCDRNLRHCHCHLNDTVWLEFNQYTLGSRWRRAAANRKTHREEGNEAEGFYGGIRKLQNQEEISTWKRLWPNETLE